MKKKISFKPYRLAMALLFLSAGSMGFAQRGGRGGERGGERQNNPQRSEQRQPRQMPSVENRQRQSPGAGPTIDRSRMGRIERQTPAENRGPVMQRPTAEAPIAQRREERQRERNDQGGFGQQQRQQQQPSPSVQRPSVNNNGAPTDARWNNRINRPTPDNSRTMANNNRNYNRNYNNGNTNSNRNYNNRSYNNNRNYNRNYTNRSYNIGSYYGSRPRYSRPPVIWQGTRFYSHYNYYYHPYRPYYYGSFYHPFGYFLTSLANTAIWFSWNNQHYGYDQGVYYEPYNNGYRVIPAPIGANVSTLPKGFTTVNVEGDLYYYYAGTFYVPGTNRYEIVPAPPGAVVFDLPEGAKEVRINDTVYLEYNGTFYLPVLLDGKEGYEVVNTEEDDNF